MSLSADPTSDYRYSSDLERLRGQQFAFTEYREKLFFEPAVSCVACLKPICERTWPHTDQRGWIAWVPLTSDRTRCVWLCQHCFSDFRDLLEWSEIPLDTSRLFGREPWWTVSQGADPPFGPLTTASTSELTVTWSAEAISGYAGLLGYEMTPRGERRLHGPQQARPTPRPRILDAAGYRKPDSPRRTEAEIEVRSTG